MLSEHVREAHHHLPEDQVDELVEVHGLHEAGLHLLALARLVSHVERGDDAAHSAHVGGVVRRLHRGVVRPGPVGLAGEHHHPAYLGSHRALVGLVVRVGALGPPAGQGHVDQVGPLRAERLVVQSMRAVSPGVKLSITTSDWSDSRFALSLSSAVSRSSVTLFLPRFHCLAAGMLRDR